MILFRYNLLCYDIIRLFRAHSSVVEHFIHIEGVPGSIPGARTLSFS